MICSFKENGKCLKGLYGGRPSDGVCYKICKERDSTEPAPVVDLSKSKFVGTVKEEMPTLAQMTEHFAKSMIKWAGSGFALLDKEQYIRRRQVCSVCNGGWRCPTCGCSIWAKAHLDTQKCDRKLWESKISVIIPIAKNENIDHIKNTIKSLRENAINPIEIILMFDDCYFNITTADVIYSFDSHVGERVALNKGVDMALGTHILRIDSHCSMSKNWDIELLRQCKDKTVCVSVIHSMDSNWNVQPDEYTFVSISPNAQEKWWYKYPQNPDLIAEPTLSLTGCGWLCSKEFYTQHLRQDEDLSKWGGQGAEITLKTEKAGGVLVLCKKVVCGHIFNTNKQGYSVTPLYDTQKKLIERYGKFLYNAVRKFKDVPYWEDVKEDYLDNPMKYYKDKV